MKVAFLGPKGTVAPISQVAAELSASTPLVESGLWIDGSELLEKGGGLTATRGHDLRRADEGARARQAPRCRVCPHRDGGNCRRARLSRPLTAQVPALSGFVSRNG